MGSLQNSDKIVRQEIKYNRKILYYNTLYI